MLNRIRAVRVEDFNAKALRRNDAKWILSMTIRFTKRWMILNSPISLFDFASLLLGVFALSRCCIVQDE
jgi:hypothetical protein